MRELASVDWTYNLSAPRRRHDADRRRMPPVNAVYSTSGATAPGNNDFAWDGKDANGNQLPDGQYTLSVSATAADGSAVTNTIASKALVTAVDMSGSTPQLILSSMEIPLSEVSLVGSNTTAASSTS